jgi:hypothetical protein
MSYLDAYHAALAKSLKAEPGGEEKAVKYAWQVFFAEVKTKVAAMSGAEKHAYFLALTEWNENAQLVSREDYLKLNGVIA